MAKKTTKKKVKRKPYFGLDVQEAIVRYNAEDKPNIRNQIYRDEIAVNKDGALFNVEPETWEEYKYTYDTDKGELKKHVVGTFTQIPLILAWAITIHKSQGSTIPSVHIDLDKGSFDHGQTYVALSRTEEISDISLANPIKDYDIKVDPRVKDFYARTFK